jgi:hypothetical protein
MRRRRKKKKMMMMRMKKMTKQNKIGLKIPAYLSANVVTSS